MVKKRTSKSKNRKLRFRLKCFEKRQELKRRFKSLIKKLQYTQISSLTPLKDLRRKLKDVVYVTPIKVYELKTEVAQLKLK